MGNIVVGKVQNEPACKGSQTGSSFDNFLMLYQTEFLRTDASSRREPLDAPVMIRQGRGQQSSRLLLEHLPEYSQKQAL